MTNVFYIMEFFQSYLSQQFIAIGINSNISLLHGPDKINLEAIQAETQNTISLLQWVHLTLAAWNLYVDKNSKKIKRHPRNCNVMLKPITLILVNLQCFYQQYNILVSIVNYLLCKYFYNIYFLTRYIARGAMYQQCVS